MAASAYYDQIQKLYIAYFGRPADPQGLTYWATQTDAAGGDLSAAINGFASSNESTALYGSSSPTQLVTAIYQAVFNRTPEAAGLSYWVEQLSSGAVNGPRAAWTILNSAGDGDNMAVANKLAAANAFTAQLDTQAEVTGYSGTSAAAYGRAYLNGVDSTAFSLQQATASTTLNSTVATATNTGTSNSSGSSGVISNPLVPATQSYTLTTGVDTVTGTALGDTITATVAGAFGKGDSINGGAGNDTLKVTDSGAVNSTGVTVTNVETASITSGSTLTLDTTGWTGLTSLTTQSNGNAAASSVTAGSATALTITSTGTQAGTLSDITTTGGSTVNVTQTASNAVNTIVTLGSVTVNGGSSTTKVSVENSRAATAGASTAGVTANSVMIIDVNGGTSSSTKSTITSASINGYNTAFIQDNALTDLSLANGSGTVTINNSASGSFTDLTRTLNLTVNGLTGGTLTDSSIYTTLNLTTTGAASAVSAFTMKAVTTLNLSGTELLTLGSISGLGALSTVNVSGSGGFKGTLSSANLKTIDASGSSGPMTITLNPTVTTYSGGSGVDTITLTATPSKSISGGAGNADVLSMTALNASTLSNSTYLSGFEQLTLTSPSTQTINLVNFPGVNTVSTLGATSLVFNGWVSGNTLKLTGTGTGYTLNGTALQSGKNDTLNLTLSQTSNPNSNSGVTFASKLTADYIENLNISMSNADATPSGSFLNTVSITDTALKSITVTGNAGLNLSTNSNNVTSLDASGLTLGGLTWTAGASQTALDIKGSATGPNTIILYNATKAQLTYTGGSGADTVTLGNLTQAASINVGSGADRVVIDGVQTSKSTFATVTGMSAGSDDSILFSANSRPLTQVSNQVVMGLKLTGQTTLDGYLDLAAQGDGGTQSILTWFQFAGNTYIVQDNSSGSTFVEGETGDMFVKLTGTVDLGTATVFTGNISLT